MVRELCNHQRGDMGTIVLERTETFPENADILASSLIRKLRTDQVGAPTISGSTQSNSWGGKENWVFGTKQPYKSLVASVLNGSLNSHAPTGASVRAHARTKAAFHDETADCASLPRAALISAVLLLGVTSALFAVISICVTVVRSRRGLPASGKALELAEAEW